MGGNREAGMPSNRENLTANRYRSGLTNRLLLRFYTLNEYYKREYSGYGGNFNNESVVKELGVPADEVTAAIRYLENSGLVSRDGNTSASITTSGINMVEDTMSLISIIGFNHGSDTDVGKYIEEPDTYHEYVDKIRDSILKDGKNIDVRNSLLSTIHLAFSQLSG